MDLRCGGSDEGRLPTHAVLVNESSSLSEEASDGNQTDEGLRKRLEGTV